jgi:hypothetical protein
MAMKRTVYQFICTQHAAVLEGAPVVVLDAENSSWHLNLSTMRCPRSNLAEGSCEDTWTDRTCNHVHIREGGAGSANEPQRCNSMTCWNYRHSHMWTKDKTGSGGN